MADHGGDLFISKLLIEQLGATARGEESPFRVLYLIARGEISFGALTTNEAKMLQAAAEDALIKAGEKAWPFVKELQRSSEW